MAKEKYYIRNNLPTPLCINLKRPDKKYKYEGLYLKARSDGAKWVELSKEDYESSEVQKYIKKDVLSFRKKKVDEKPKKVDKKSSKKSEDDKDKSEPKKKGSKKKSKK